MHVICAAAVRAPRAHLTSAMRRLFAGAGERVTHHHQPTSTHMVGYAWINSLRYSSPVATLTHPTRSHSSVRLVGWVSVGPSLERDRRINPTRNPPSSANLSHMMGYAWTNSLRSLSPMATLTIPQCEAMDLSRIVPAPACASAPTDRAPARGCDGTPPPPPR